MSTIFTKIINGEIPSYKITENEKFIAFLDINPLTMGHLLVVPKKETDYFFDLEDEILAAMNVFAKPIAKALEKTVDCKRVAVVVLGLEVPHAHLHLIPFNKESDVHFDKAKLKLSEEEFAQLQENIKKNL
ncbi:MAG: HIT family protein [Bacteroidota bacterium]|nr:HIT family protein [Bacteroidota bacterium]